MIKYKILHWNLIFNFIWPFCITYEVKANFVQAMIIFNFIEDIVLSQLPRHIIGWAIPF